MVAGSSTGQASGSRYVVVGLGNPGGEYQDTRHNAGFQAVDILGEQLGARYWKSKCGSLVAETTYRGTGSNGNGPFSVILAKPLSFMNLSGGPVKSIVSTYGIDLSHLIVIQDELDLEPGCVRIKQGGGHAGHNGLRSINDKLGSGDYVRVRVGTGMPGGHKPGADYVLEKLRGQRLEEFKIDCDKAAQIALCIMDEGVAAAMNRYNTKE